MSEYGTKHEHHIWFDSMEELKKEVPSLLARRNASRIRTILTTNSGQKWYGCTGHVEAVSLCDNGWPELSRMLRERVDELKSTLDLGQVEAVTIQTRRRKRTRHDYGDTLDITRVWSGHLDTAWERPTRRNVLSPTQRYASVMVDLGLWAGQRVTEGLWRAAEAMCMVEMLTSMGVNVEVWCGSNQTCAFVDGPESLWTAVRIKEYMQPLNDDRLAVMTSGTFYRSYGFEMIGCPDYMVSMSLGMPTQTGMVKPLRDRAAAGERVFRIGACFTKEQAVADLKKAMTELSGKKEAA